jgi:GTP 3',8-cyclase
MTVTELGLPGLRTAPGSGPSRAAGDPRPDGLARPDDPRLVDRFGRIATDLRVSLTDRCNLRCTYCMPAEGLEWTPTAELLTDDEIVRLVRIGVFQLGIDKIRFTGGEPTLRRGLESILSRVAALDPRPEISLTTNGIGLARRAPALADAGVDRLNVSLDTLRADRFARITRRDRLADVLAGMSAAQAAGLNPVKVNAVLLRGVNDDEAVPLLRYCLEHDYHLRFIEQMPLDAQHSWQRDQMITAAEILDRLSAAFTLTPAPERRGGAPAEKWLVDGGPGRVGVIASVTRPFCGDCDRTRLTGDGQLRSCLFARGETDLRALLRGGYHDTEIADAWRGAMWAKAAGHGIDDPGFLQPDRPMSAIGG